ncbi:MAG: tryptophan--tRNA ligase [candidate division WOR-3 bacterium]
MKKRVLSGTRPTGKAHLGNLAGAFFNWARIQDSGEYETFYCVVDWHSLTTDYANTGVIRPNTLEMVRDWLAVGLSPEKSVLFLQSAVPEHAELHLLFSMLVSLSKALRVPTFKEHLEDTRAETMRDKLRTETGDVSEIMRKMKTEAVDSLTEFILGVPDPDTVKQKLSSELSKLTDRASEVLARSVADVDFSDIPGFEAISCGFLEYPILQAADIAIYRAHAVPVGEDQVPHIEFAREVVRRFNSTYGQVFPEPEALLTPVPRILGSDRRKMSKRYDNGIYLADPPEVLEKKLMGFFTDPARIRKNDPGHPDDCPVFLLIKAFLPERAGEVKPACERGKLGCVDCKRRAAAGLNEFLAPMRERRASFGEEYLLDVLREGSRKARKEAQETMSIVRKAMKMDWL